MEVVWLGGLIGFHSNNADALSYQAAALRVLAGQSPYTAMQLAGPYSLVEAAGGGGFVYPPPAALLLVPFALGTPFFVLFKIASVAGLLTIVMLIMRPRTVLGVFFWVAVTLAQPGLTEVKEDQISIAVAALFGLVWLGTSSAAVLGGALKPYTLVGLIMTIRRRGSWRWSLILGACLLALSLVVPGGWGQFLTAWSNGRPGCPDYALPSSACAGFGWVGYLGAAVLLFAAWRVRSESLAFALIGVATILPAPDLYAGYLLIPFVGLLPLAGRILVRLGDRETVANQTSIVQELYRDRRTGS